MQLHLDDQVAVVLGGASGIGLAIAKEFAREGCRVGIIDKNEQTETLARSASEGIGGSKIRGIVADVTNYGAVQTAATRIEGALDCVQHVVYTVGMGSGKFGYPFWNL